MGSTSDAPPKPWIETPCIYSEPLSRAAGCNIYLKLENLQPSGSFKSRGIGNLMLRAVADAPPPPASAPGQDPPGAHFYCSSGGNAGLACATAALALRRPATIVVPTITSPLMVAKLRARGADVRQVGADWAAADAHLRGRLMAAHPRAAGRAVYVPPFDHPHVWAGAASLVAELPAALRVDALVCSVGGGGLLCGLMEGLAARAGAAATRVLAVETEGAASLAASVRAGELVALPAIATVAISLGAPRVAEAAFEWARRGGGDGVVCATVSDAEAVRACVRFLDDVQMLVEPACGATVATAYNGALRKYLGEGMGDEEWAGRNVVLVVCGGSGISLEMLQEYRERFGV